MKKGDPTAAGVTISPPQTWDLIYPAHDPIQEDLLTTILCAGEMLAAPDCTSNPERMQAEHAVRVDSRAEAVPDDYRELLQAIAQINTLLAEDPKLDAQMASLPAAFGSGESLRILFRSLFHHPLAPPVPNREGEPLLSDREMEVLREADGEMSHQAIGAKLGISEKTVRRHFHNIYKALGVDKQIPAIRLAIELGYLEPDVLGISALSMRFYSTGMHLFKTFCANVGLTDPPLDLGKHQSLAACGLLLLAISGAAARQTFGDTRIPPIPGEVCEVDLQGRVVRAFTAPGMGAVRSLAVAPFSAAQHGFTPGNLFAVHDHKPQQGLNRGAISEFTPEGGYVRTFCGGQDVGTRLIGALSLAFAADGRLLATSGLYTDAILAFTQGGRAVERFAEGYYVQIGVGPQGNVYGTLSSTHIDLLCVLDPAGQRLRTFGGLPMARATTKARNTTASR